VGRHEIPGVPIGRAAEQPTLTTFRAVLDGALHDGGVAVTDALREELADRLDTDMDGLEVLELDPDHGMHGDVYVTMRLRCPKIDPVVERELFGDPSGGEG
jgi:hypothetical protein